MLYTVLNGTTLGGGCICKEREHGGRGHGLFLGKAKEEEERLAKHWRNVQADGFEDEADQQKQINEGGGGWWR